MKRRVPLIAFTFGVILGIGWVASAHENPDEDLIVDAFQVEALGSP